MSALQNSEWCMAHKEVVCFMQGWKGNDHLSLQTESEGHTIKMGH